MMENEDESQTVELLVPKELTAAVESALGETAGLLVEKSPPSRDVSVGVEILAITAHFFVIVAELLKLREHFSNKSHASDTLVVRNVEGTQIALKDASEKSLKDLVSNSNS